MGRTIVVPQTADAALLDQELRSVADVEKIESVPLDQRLAIVDFTRRVDLALSAHAPEKVAIAYVPDGDVDRTPERICFGTLREKIGRTAALLRAHHLGTDAVIAILLPGMPAIYWSILGAMSCGIP